MKKLIISESMERSLRNIKFFMVQETYNRTESGKSWKSKPSEIKREEISINQYVNIFNSVEFFRNLGGYERVTKGYTCEGYIPVQLTSTSPDKKTKIIRKFTPIK